MIKRAYYARTPAEVGKRYVVCDIKDDDRRPLVETNRAHALDYMAYDDKPPAIKGLERAQFAGFHDAQVIDNE